MTVNNTKYNQISTKQKQLSALHQAYTKCTACPLGTAGRTTIVFGEGNPNAKLVIVGEGPGAEEDKHGRPFIGRSGKLLTKALEAAGIKREEIFITNVVKCRPPDNRAPKSIEISTCTTLLLKKQLAIIEPDVIIALGKTSLSVFSDLTMPLKSLREQNLSYNAIKLIPSYHPAYILRNTKMLSLLVEDLKKAHLNTF